MPQQKRLSYEFPSLVLRSTDFPPEEQKLYRVFQQLFGALKGYLVVIATAVNTNIAVSGTTAERPTKDLLPGQMYFDTTLNMPIWRNKDNNGWVDASGASI